MSERLCYTRSRSSQALNLKKLLADELRLSHARRVAAIYAAVGQQGLPNGVRVTVVSHIEPASASE